MQRFLLPVGGPLLCIALTIGLLLAGKASISGAENAAAPEMTLETPDLNDVPTIGEAPSADGGPVMDEVLETPERAEGGSEPGKADGADTLTEPQPSSRQDQAVTSAPLAPPPSTPAPSPASPDSDALEETILRHPVALAAGLVQFGDRTIQIAGLRPQAADRLCTQDTGTWPCGTMARTAFRNFIRARAFTCQTPKGGWTGTTTARCTIGSDDPALWLARNGWAEPETDDPALQAAANAARQTGKGFYRN
jgi:endonuclease YncB( thermonuclease family)